MLTLSVWLVAVLALPLFVSMLVLAIEILAALLPVRNNTSATAVRPTCAVLLPAHNEESGIARVIAAIQPQLTTGDRVLVVADNCTDATAAVARSAGAEVVERTDAVRRGKGYALDFGVRTICAKGTGSPGVIVIVDADCIVEPGALDHLVRTASTTGRPVQAAYVMDVPQDGSARAQLAAFLFALKNVVRPGGLDRLGLPCLLTGTGMAFPRELISAAPLASGNIVEDMQLGIDLAIAGRPPLFCSAARVRSELPATNSAAASQRTRWIHGHLNTLLNQTPRLLVAAIRQRRMDLLGLALEVSVPPLSLLTLFGVVTCCVMTMACLFGGPVMPAVLSLSIGAMGLSALALAYACFGRQYLPLSGLLAVPLELASRLSVLIRFLYRPQAAWIRTARRHAN